MRLLSWEELPQNMQTEAVRVYYDALQGKKPALFIKRLFDIAASALLLLILSPVLLIFALLIKIDSRGPVLYRQERVTQYGRRFRIHKLRTMVQGADSLGPLLTTNGDSRITGFGAWLRKYGLDELPQLLDVLRGNMSFVGMRPEVPKYVECYTDEMLATLLLPAGITSETCIRYRGESRLLDSAEDVDRVYIERVLPAKMYYGLKSIESFSLRGELMTMLRTALSLLGKEYGEAATEAETQENEAA